LKCTDAASLLSPCDADAKIQANFVKAKMRRGKGQLKDILSLSAALQAKAK
jgi:hypothetical protein